MGEQRPGVLCGGGSLRVTQGIRLTVAAPATSRLESWSGSVPWQLLNPFPHRPLLVSAGLLRSSSFLAPEGVPGRRERVWVSSQVSFL